jgi:hypothetical protein
LSLSNEQIKELIERFEKDSKALRKEILDLCWHMRGGLSYDDGMMLSHEDRDILHKIVKEHLDTTQKTNLPYF